MSDQIRIRSAHPQEFRACRMLLPPEHELSLGADYIVAVQDQTPFILGAAFYISESKVTHSVRVRVIRTHRRRGIGALLLNRIAEIATERGSEVIQCSVNSIHEPDAAPFLLAQGFSMYGRTTTVRTDLVDLKTIILPLEERIRKRAQEPAPIVPLSDSPINSVTALYRAELARSPWTTAWALLGAVSSPRYQKSPVLLSSGRVAGFLLYYLRGETAVVPARVVAPEFQRGSTNILLMAGALRTALKDGALFLEFDIPENNSDTEKLARRLATQSIRIRDQYIRGLVAH